MLRWVPLVLLLLGCGAERRVVVASLDGFRADYASRAETPTIDGFVRDGAHAERMIPPWQSQTFPGHATLATGVRPEAHGILNNRFKDRERARFDYGNDGSWYDADPLWIHAERHGLRAHVYHWVGSSGPRNGVEASEWRPFAKGDREQQHEAAVAVHGHEAVPSTGSSPGPGTSSTTRCSRPASSTRCRSWRRSPAWRPQTPGSRPARASPGTRS